jgi:hypothetical protein
LLGRLRIEDDVVDDLLTRHVTRLHRVRDLMLDERRPDITGRDAIGGDAESCELQGDGFGQASDTVFRRYVSGFERRSDKRVRGGGRDDTAPFLRLHARYGGADRMEGGGKIDRNDRVPFLDRKVLDRRDELYAGVVDENIDRTELALSVSDHGRNFRGLAHVGAVIKRLDAEVLFDGGAFFLDRSGVAHAIDHDIRAVLSQHARDGEANAAGRAGDKRISRSKRHEQLLEGRPKPDWRCDHAPVLSRLCDSYIAPQQKRRAR